MALSLRQALVAHWSQSGDDEPARECRACTGRRLRPEALAVRYRSRSIADFGVLDVGTARGVLARGREAAIARDVLAELVSRLDFLCEVGLGYLRLDRAAPTLSGGEAQRIRLAAQLGSNLRGVCYILDEPTIGLHARDNAMLLDTLRALRKKGNTVVVVEHNLRHHRRGGRRHRPRPGGRRRRWAGGRGGSTGGDRRRAGLAHRAGAGEVPRRAAVNLLRHGPTGSSAPPIEAGRMWALIEAGRTTVYDAASGSSSLSVRLSHMRQ